MPKKELPKYDRPARLMQVIDSQLKMASGIGLSDIERDVQAEIAKSKDPVSDTLIADLYKDKLTSVDLSAENVLIGLSVHLAKTHKTKHAKSPPGKGRELDIMGLTPDYLENLIIPLQEKDGVDSGYAIAGNQANATHWFQYLSMRQKNATDAVQAADRARQVYELALEPGGLIPELKRRNVPGWVDTGKGGSDGIDPETSH